MDEIIEQLAPKEEVLEVKVEGKTLQGMRYDLAHTLRLAPYFKSYRDIAKVLGVSHTSVQNYLSDQGIKGYRFDWLTKRWAKGRSDEELAHLLNVPLDNVPYRRRQLGLKKFEWTNLILRKDNLIVRLFGPEWTFGPGFNDYFRKVGDEFLTSKRRKEIIIGYYISGWPTTEAERAYRSMILADLKECELGSTEILEKMNILRRCRW